MLSVLKKPLLTEKASKLGPLRQYAFEVSPEANKIQIKEAVETLFEVKVQSVRTVVNKPKYKMRMTRRGIMRGSTNLVKKAYVTLQPNYSIDVVSGEGASEE